MNLVFVTPWFGTDRPGGAERLVELYARDLAAKGCKVTIATTTSRGPNHVWGPARDNFPAGKVETQHGVVLRRFSTDVRKPRKYKKIDRMLRLGTSVGLAEEQAWARHSIQSQELLHWLAKNADISAIIVAPYPFGLSYSAVFAFPNKAFLIPCLHGEGYARLAITREMLCQSRGLIFNAPEEAALTQSLINVHTANGAAGTLPGSLIIPPPISLPSLPEAGKVNTWRKDRLKGRPYILSLGKQTQEKGVPSLISLYSEARNLAQSVSDIGSFPLLAIAGSGDGLGVSIGDGIIDLGYLSDAEKWLALSGAQWLVQASPNESFSYVLMEGWHASTPCLVSAASRVAAGHVTRSGGGFIYRDARQLAVVLMGDLPGVEETSSTGVGENQRVAMAASGAEYVQKLIAVNPAEKLYNFIGQLI